MSKRVLVLTYGGREHAMGWKLAQSPHVSQLYFAPGNCGTAQLGENVDIAVTDSKNLIKFAKAKKIDLTVVGPDAPAPAGVVDAFIKNGLKIFGPSKKAARIESSKIFAKRLMRKAGIPTAAFKEFSDIKKALAHLAAIKYPVVVKADGLSGGKGVIICRGRATATKAITSMMRDGQFGDSGKRLVIEEFLEGQETSLHAISDGKTYLMFPPSQDYKQAYDGDRGPNTGGVGVIAPLPWDGAKYCQQLEEQIVKPALVALKSIGAPFVGCLYPGIMNTADGPKVIEYNARFGDPEMQVYMRLLKNDLYEVLDACIKKQLSKIKLRWQRGYAVNIVLCSKGYPNKYKTGYEVSGIEAANKDPAIEIFHHSTILKDDKLLTSGGRVLNVTATAPTLKLALAKAYKAATKIHFKNKYYRKDIGYRVLA